MKQNFHFIILLLFLSIAIFVGYNITQLDNEIKTNQYNTLVNDLSIVANNFSIWMCNKKSMLETSKDTVDNFTYDEVTQWATKNPYLNLNNNNPDVSQTYIGLANGQFITGGEWIPPSDYDPRTRVWYQEAVEADTTIVSSVYIDRETGDQLVTISSPLYLEDEFVGVISADVFLNNIHAFLDTQLRNPDTYAYIIDQSGMVTMHSKRPDFIGQNLYTDIKDQNIIPYFEQAKSSIDMIRMEYVFQDQNIRGIVKNMEDGEWYLAVALEYNNTSSFWESFTLQHALFNFTILLIIVILIIIIFRIKVKMDNLHTRLKYDNEKDFLTGIYNRRYFNIFMENLWKTSLETETISVLMMDIDFFKQYNDTYGHIKGDEILKEVTNCISSHIRKSDILARYGGEEFALVLKDISPEATFRIATTIKEALYELNLEHKSSIHKRITISIGVVTVKPSNGISVRDTVDQADKALYDAKESGRNMVSVYEGEES